MVPPVLGDVNLDGGNDIVIGGYDDYLDVITLLPSGDHELVYDMPTGGLFAAPSSNRRH